MTKIYGIAEFETKEKARVACDQYKNKFVEVNRLIWYVVSCIVCTRGMSIQLYFTLKEAGGSGQAGGYGFYMNLKGLKLLSLEEQIIQKLAWENRSDRNVRLQIS